MTELALFGGTKVREEPWPAQTMFARTDDLQAKLLASCERGLSLFTTDEVARAESRLAGFFGLAHAVCVSSGTAALETACHAVGVGPGDEVIVPAATYIATASAVSRAGATPVFADSDETLTLDPAAVRAAIGPRTKAVIFVSLFGNPGSLAGVIEVCREAGVPLIHDCAQGAASTLDGKWIAGLGDLVCLSFYESKHLPAGEGGAVLTGDEAVFRRAKAFSNMWELRSDGLPTHVEPDYLRPVSYPAIGTNFRMPSLTATLVMHGLDHLRELAEHCHEIGEQYRCRFTEWGELPSVPGNARVAWYAQPLLLRPGFARDAAWKALMYEGTPLGRYYYTMLPEQEAFTELGAQEFPVTRRLVDTALVLPTHRGISLSEVDDLEKSMKKIVDALWRQR